MLVKGKGGVRMLICDLIMELLVVDRWEGVFYVMLPNSNDVWSKMVC